MAIRQFERDKNLKKYGKNLKKRSVNQYRVYKFKIFLLTFLAYVSTIIDQDFVTSLTHTLIEILQYRTLNKHLFIILIDIVLINLIPEHFANDASTEEASKLIESENTTVHMYADPYDVPLPSRGDERGKVSANQLSDFHIR